MINIQENVALAPFTTFRVGGPARYFTQVSGVGELREALTWARERTLETFILGGGSNLLVSDDGFDGLVVRIGFKGIETLSSPTEPQHVTLSVAAGEEWDSFVQHCVNANLAGVECLSGIPGSVGATPIQNVGAYGQDVSETITSVEVIDRRDLELRVMTSKECEFGYRYSFFKNIEPDRYVVTRVTYSLLYGGDPALRYPELRRHLEEKIGDRLPTLREVREAVLGIRRRKGMVIDESDPDSRSAGSFFMNPVLTVEEFAALEQRAKDAAVLGEGDAVPQYPAADGKIKSSAAWLIERAGFGKGYGQGDAGISSKHTLALINRGNAKAADVVALVDEIKTRVRETFGVELHPEPNFIGF